MNGGGSGELKGYKVGAGGLAHGSVFADMLLTGPVSLATYVSPHLALRLAAVLRAGVQPEATPGAVDLAVGGVFLAVEFTDGAHAGDPGGVTGAFVLGERLLARPPRGPLRLSRDGRPIARYDLDGDENPGERLAWLAGVVGGLEQGQIVLLEPEAGAGPVQVSPGAHALSALDGTFLAVETRP